MSYSRKCQFYWTAFVFLLLSTFYVESQDNLSPDLDIDRLKRATVFIMQVESQNLTTTCVGTGTLVRYDGLILTNAFHTVQSDQCPGDILFVALTLDSDEPPVPKYRAEVVQANVGLDIALLRITQDFDGRELEEDSLPILPFVQLADDTVDIIDQTVTVLGYPDIGNSVVQAQRGSITSYIAEPSGGEASWMKIRTLDASPIPGTMTGGAAYTRAGNLIGILTSAPTSQNQATSECVTIEDTNLDGFINSNDRCIPVGEAISVLRSVTLARPLVQAASLGLQINLLTSPIYRVESVSSPTISNPFFAPAIDNNQPTTVLRSAPAGTDSLYLFFDYRNMTPETVYEVRVTVDGIPNQALSLPPVRWSGGTNGLWYVGATNQTRPNGRYEYRVFVDGVEAAASAINVGGVAEDAPFFGNITFGLLNQSGDLSGSGYVLPTGNTATARFIHRNMVPGVTNWTSIWSFNGERIEGSRTSGTWENTGELNTGITSLQPAGGLSPGNYRLELFIDNSLAALGDVTVAGSQSGPLARVFTNVEFRRANSLVAEPSENTGTNFPDGAYTLYAYFDWEQIEPGTLWTLQWSVDNEVFYRQTIPWSSSLSGSDFTMQLTAPGGLPDGTYSVDLLINDIVLAQGEVSIGIGQLPIDRLNQAEGVRLGGQIIDLETNKGIEAASIFIISDQFAVEDFVNVETGWNESQLYAVATTDRDGYFEVDRPLQFDTPYSVLIEVEGYLPVSVDGYEVTRERLQQEGGNPLEILIPLTRD